MECRGGVELLALVVGLQVLAGVCAAGAIVSTVQLARTQRRLSEAELQLHEILESRLRTRGPYHGRGVRER